ncbi:MAG: hypothetical protein ACFFDN_06205 [Candidatus Hodarchaeota archaeon]
MKSPEIRLAYNQNPSKDLWEKTIDQLGIERNYFICWEEGEVQKRLGNSVIRLLVSQGPKIIGLYSAVIEIKKINFLKFLNVRCGGREEGPGLFFKKNINQDKIFPLVLNKIRRLIFNQYGFGLKFISFYFPIDHKLFRTWKCRNKYTPFIDLSKDTNSLLMGMKKETRNQIRQAKKRGTKVELMNNLEGLEIFYKLNFDYFTKVRKKWMSDKKSFFAVVLIINIMLVK